MATTEIIEQGIKYIETVFGKKVEEARRAAYADLLKDLPDNVLRAAIKHTAATATFFPAPGEIRSAAAYLGKLAYDIPAADEAWGELVNRAHAPRTVKYYCDGYIRLYNHQATSTADYWRNINAMQEHERDCKVCSIRTIEYEFSHPLVGEVAKRLGWPDRFWSDNIGVDRGRYIKTYEAEIERLTQKSTLIPSVREFVNSGQGLLEDDRRAAFDTGEAKSVQRQIAALTRSMDV